MAGITFSEGSGLQDSVFGKSQAPIRMIIEANAQACEENSVLPHIFNMETSSSWSEKYTTMTAMQGFKPVGENGEYPDDHMQEGFSKTFEHMVWKNRFTISREMVDDSKNIDFKKEPAAFTISHYTTQEKFGASLLGNAIQGNTSSVYEGVKFPTTTADGKCLFANDHPSKVRGKAQSNVFKDEFSEDALAAAETAMQLFKGDTGEILTVSPDTILIGSDYKLKKKVLAVIGADKDPFTSNNAFNYLFGRWKVIVWPYLNQYITEGTSPWILMDSKYNEMYSGAVWLDRVKLEVKSRLDEGNDANIWQGYARYTAGFNDWRFACVGGVTSGTQLVS